MNIALDFDGVITDVDLHRLIFILKKNGNEIWIVTARDDNEFNLKFMQPYLTKFGLTKYSVIFCGDKEKWEILKKINSDIYIDNISDEFENIKNHTSVTPLLWA